MIRQNRAPASQRVGILDFGFCILHSAILHCAGGACKLDPSRPNLDQSRINLRRGLLDFGFWILDSGFWILDSGFWILDSGSGFWIFSSKAVLGGHFCTNTHCGVHTQRGDFLVGFVLYSVLP